MLSVSCAFNDNYYTEKRSSNTRKATTITCTFVSKLRCNDKCSSFEHNCFPQIYHRNYMHNEDVYCKFKTFKIWFDKYRLFPPILAQVAISKRKPISIWFSIIYHSEFHLHDFTIVHRCEDFFYCIGFSYLVCSQNMITILFLHFIDARVRPSINHYVVTMFRRFSPVRTACLASQILTLWHMP